jgi:hypothetical protein
MDNSLAYQDFFDRIKLHINNKTFSKITMAKTIGNPDLLNIYFKPILVEEKLQFETRYRFQQEEKLETLSLEQVFEVIKSHMMQPFTSVILFTNEADVFLKINKKKNAAVTEQPPTFRNADPVFSELK